MVGLKGPIVAWVTLATSNSHQECPCPTLLLGAETPLALQYRRSLRAASGGLVSKAVLGVLGSAQRRTRACVKRCCIQTVRKGQLLPRSFTVR